MELCFVFFPGGLAWSAPASEQAKLIRALHIQNELLVRFQAGVYPKQARTVLSRHGIKVIKRYKRISGLYLVSLRPGLAVETAIEELKAEPFIEYAEPNYIVEFDSACPAPCIANDPKYIDQWGLANIRAEEAWATTTGSPDVVVAVLDSGIDYHHPDLAENIWVNPSEIPGNGIDDDGDGYIDDVYGYNAVTDTCLDDTCLHPAGDPLDDDTSVLGHGTRLAGIIGAVGNNTLGIAGVNWHVKLLPIKIRYEPDRQSSLALVLAGMDYVIAKWNQGVNIPLVHISFLISTYSQALQTGIDAARDAGILLIWSAGNSGRNVDSDPTAFFSHVYDNVLPVAAINNTNALSSFSNYGQVGIQLAAPGVGILSTVRSVYTPRYQTDDGTSYAAPFVTGVAALLSAYDPTLSYTGLKAHIISATTREDGLAGRVASGGRLNAADIFSAPITDLWPAGYQLARVEVSQKYYLDRTFTVTSVPQGFERLWWVRTKNADKANADANHINIGLGRDAIVYVAYDPRAISVPDWLSPGQGWTDTGLSISVSDAGAGTLRIYSKQFSPGMVVLGGNQAAGYVGPPSGYSSNYIVLIRLTDVPPVAPTDLSAADVSGDNGGAISLSWTPSVSSDVIEQRVYRAAVSGGPYSLIRTITNNTIDSYIDTGLIDETTYYYVVRAYDGTNESANSNESSAIPSDNTTAPVAPTGLSAADVAGDNGKALALTWTVSVSTNVTQQRIYRGTSSGGPYMLVLTITDNTTGSYIDTGLINGTAYYYVVRAFNGTDESVNSNEASAVPLDNNPPVISIVASGSITSTGAMFTWTTDEASDSQVEYGMTTAYGSSSLLDPTLVISHSINLSNLSPSTLYHYRVMSRDAAGNLSISADYTFTTGTPSTGSVVQSGSVTIPSGSQSAVVMINPVNTTKAFLVFGISFNDANPNFSQVTGQITNATTLTFQRSIGTSSPAVTVKWYVAEFINGVSVQRGSTAMDATTKNIPLTAVDTIRSFPIITCRVSGSSYTNDDFVKARLTSSTNLELTINTSNAAGIVEWQVIEFADSRVQSGSLSFGTADSLRTVTMSAVDTAKSWLIYTYKSDAGTTANIGQKLVQGLISNGTTLTFDRANVGQAMDLTWYLVEFTDGTTVQQGSQSFGTTETQKNVPISVVDPARSLAAGGYFMRGGRSSYAGNDNPGVGWMTLDLTSSTNLQITRGVTNNSTANIGWFVISFP